MSGYLLAVKTQWNGTLESNTGMILISQMFDKYHPPLSISITPCINYTLSYNII